MGRFSSGFNFESTIPNLVKTSMSRRHNECILQSVLAVTK